METPGTILKREREAQGLTLKEIAAITRIPCRSLQYIEEDRFDLFPAEVFARGFLRNYARELQISGEDVILTYNALRSQRSFTPKIEVSIDPVIKPISPPLPSKALPPAPAPVPYENTSSKSIVSRLTFASRGNSPGKSSSASGVDSQRTFRFAYLIVFLVVATSLGLSVLFTGTGEAEEDRRRTRQVAEESNSEDPFIIPRNQGLSSPTIPQAAPPSNISAEDDPFLMPSSQGSLMAPAAVPQTAQPSNLQLHDPAQLQIDE